MIASTTVLGGLALTSFAIHSGYHLWRGTPYDLLWACNLAALVLAIGCFSRLPALVSVAVLWLTLGLPLWLLDLAGGGEFIVTSPLPHVGCLILGILGVRALGWSHGSWYRATAAFCLLLLVTRQLTPRVHNVNVAFSVWRGWEHWFPRYDVYLALLLAGGTLAFLGAERVYAGIAHVP